MRKLKVATIVGTRPELIKLSRVIAELGEHTNHLLVHTGQNYDYELNGVFFGDLRLPKPHHFLEAAGETAAETIGQVITRSDQVLRKECPDAVLILGDTNSCLAAISAKRLRIPVFHMEAGNRSFDERVPEEINRRIVDHISDINLPYTAHARRYLIAEGLDPARVIKTGAPTKEVLTHYMPQIRSSEVLQDMELEANQYFVASLHREENVDSDKRLKQLVAALNSVATHHDKPVIFSTHPRTKKRLDALGESTVFDDRIRTVKALGFFDYVQLQLNSFCVLSDSGSLTEEASLLQLPAVTLREAHERPEGMDEAAILMSSVSPERLLQCIEVATAHSSSRTQINPVKDYAPTNVSKKIVRIIHSYVDYVNAHVWRKSGNP